MTNDKKCQRCGSFGGYGCYECTPDHAQSELQAAVAAALEAVKRGARIEALEAAIDAALAELDASLFTNAEHQRAKDILRAAREDTK